MQILRRRFMQTTKSTRDFYLSAYLIAVGVKLQSHNKINGNTVFNFVNDTATQKSIDTYYSMSGTVEPIIFSNSIKALKSIVHSYDKTNTNINSNSEWKNNVKQYKGNN